jgi:hypothetical protein
MQRKHQQRKLLWLRQRPQLVQLVLVQLALLVQQLVLEQLAQLLQQAQVLQLLER